MTIEIKEVTSKRDLKTFIRFPLKLYEGSPYYVPSMFQDEINCLSKDKNPAFATARARYWLAYKDGKLAGRIAGMIVPAEEEKWGEKSIRFGWIDFIDDAEVVKSLLAQVEDWGRAEGKISVHGPLGFTDLDREGMLIEGFDEMTTLATIYNYPYYPQRLEELGYGKDVDWLEYEFDISDDRLVGKVAKTAELVAKRYNLHHWRGSRKELLKIAPQVFDVINESYRHLYGTVPLTKAQVQAYIDQYFGFVIVDLISVIMDENNRAVAFGISFPSFSKALQKNRGYLFPFGFIHMLRALKNNNRADLYLVGIRDEYLGKGVNGMVMMDIYNGFVKHGIRYAESNANLEHNLAVQAQWKYFENRQHKRRRCYVKYLEASEQAISNRYSGESESEAL